VDVIEKVVLTQDTQIDQNPILPMVRFGSLIPFASKKNYYTIISFLFILIFFVGGYIYPATSEDIASNNVIWAGNEGKYDRGLFSQFYASIAFTMGVFLLGYYVNATFIRYNIKDWNYFSIGILLMLFFGLGRIGELVYDHNIFEGFKNIVLPVALIVLAFASYKIYKNMAEAI
jgi:energy-coupling factor transporter transmembrane protein EcfT